MNGEEGSGRVKGQFRGRSNAGVFSQVVALPFCVTLCLRHGALDVAILRQGTVEGRKGFGFVMGVPGLVFFFFFSPLSIYLGRESTSAWG